MKRLSVILIVIVSFLLFGCATPGPRYLWKVEPSQSGVDNDYISASLRPIHFSSTMNGYTAFTLTIKNKTSEDIELDWNKTMYIENNQTQGGFMFEGVVYKDRNNPKPPDVIFANSEFNKIIWPNKLVSFNGDWDHSVIPPGQNGVYLNIKVKDQELKGKIILNMSMVPFEESLKAEFHQIPIENALWIGDKNASKKAIVFIDPDCPFCAKFYREIKKVTSVRKDVIFYFKFFPLKFHKDAYWKSRSIVCNKSLQMLEENFDNKSIPKTECATAEIDETIVLAEKLGIRGTPTIIFANVKIQEGHISSDKLINILNEM